MKTFRVLLVVGFVANYLTGPLCRAGEPAPSLESVLAKWEEASQKCRTLDAKLTVFCYGRVFGDDRPTVTHGRFYYEAPNVGRYEIREGRQAKVNDWFTMSEVVVWKEKEVLWIHPTARSCQRMPAAKLQSFLDQPESGWWPFFKAFALTFQRPQEFLPLVVDVRAADLRQRFDVALEDVGENIQLKALPKRDLDKRRIREIGVILDGKTYLTRAMQIIPPNGNDRTSYTLDEPKVNQVPSDRGQLIDPDLSGLRVFDEF